MPQIKLSQSSCEGGPFKPGFGLSGFSSTADSEALFKTGSK
jgi:hypothetical protein